jgi:prepilin-type N-terminal cleavage/methylation domain-containing protein
VTRETKVVERIRARAGFTLIEILVAIMIMGLMLLSITKLLNAVRTTRDRIHNIQETQLAGPAIIDMIERDLLGIVTINVPRAYHLRIKNRIELGRDADRIDFVTTSDGLVLIPQDDRLVRADYNEIGYVTRPNPNDDHFLELYRREGFGVDDEPFEGGSYTFLHDQVRDLSIEIFEEDGPDIEPLEEWGMDPDDPERIGLPASIRISLTLELAPRLLREQIEMDSSDKRTVTYHRIIRFPQWLRVAEDEIPRLAVPTPPTGSTSGAGGGGGGGEPLGEDDFTNGTGNVGGGTGGSDRGSAGGGAGGAGGGGGKSGG